MTRIRFLNHITKSKFWLPRENLDEEFVHKTCSSICSESRISCSVFSEHSICNNPLNIPSPRILLYCSYLIVEGIVSIVQRTCLSKCESRTRNCSSATF